MSKHGLEPGSAKPSALWRGAREVFIELYKQSMEIVWLQLKQLPYLGSLLAVTDALTWTG